MKPKRAFDSRSWLHEIRHKTLVIGVREDFFVSLADLELLSHKIPDAILKVILKSGHMLTFERTKRFKKTIMEFLTRP